MGQPRRTPIPAPPRRRYPVGALRPAAIARGREIVAKSGAQALTLRGLARDLGVSAPALLYYFGSRDGMREAVAATVQAELDSLARPPSIGAVRDASAAIGERWIEFAEEHPNLYRLAFGDGWRGPGLGWRPGMLVSSRVPTDRLEFKLRRALDRDRRSHHLPKDASPVLSRYVAAGIHGLATARLDGAAAAAVRSSLTMLVAVVPLSQWARPPS